MLATWVKDEMQTVDLRDKRLNNLLCEVLGQLAERPTASIPAACGGHAEMTAAYRLFDNEKATFASILQAHGDATGQRMAAQPVVILTQDTTEVDLTRPEQVVAGVGPLDGNSRVGLLLHLLHAFTTDGTPLGTIHAQAWTRNEQTSGSSSLSRAALKALPLAEKESYRWVQTLAQARQVARACPATTCVCVSDSESDIYELFVAALAEPRQVEWIVRACQNRAVIPANSQDREHLREYLLAQKVLFTHSTVVRQRVAKIARETRARRQSRPARTAKLSVRASQVSLRAPYRSAGKLPTVAVNAILVRETRPPKNMEPIEWLLLTSLPIENADQVRKVIQYYCTRWMIEVFFRVLKSGCRVEERRLETLDRVLTCLAIYLIVAWRTLYVCRLSRSCPEVDCETIFDPAEWQAVWKVLRRQNPPRTPPRLQEIVRLVAELGGYVNRAAPPGPHTIWIGLQRAHDFALCWKSFGPGASAKNV